METYIVVTNNPMVKENFGSSHLVELKAVGVLELFVYIRDLVQAGHRLLTHPLCGSLKPNETPYRTVMVSSEKEYLVDAPSEMLIEECILAVRKFTPKNILWKEKVIEDFQYIDYTLISHVLEIHG